MVRFPRGFQKVAALALRILPPRSRLRRATLSRQMRSAYAAATRHDFEVMLTRYAADVEVRAGFPALDLDRTFHGHDGMLEMMSTFTSPWKRWQISPVAVVDLGDRIVGLGRLHLPASESGLEFAPEFAQVLTVRDGLCTHEEEFLSWDDGLCTHEEEFLSWDDGLRAAGLDVAAIDLGIS